ncbi:MAG: hypothetical protein J6B28_09155 [Eubacterium sp.]|nr:hypothetical protein [Eubacterium sp.]
MSRRSDGSGILAGGIAVGFILVVGLIMDAGTPKCIKSGCDNDQAEGSNYCYYHKLYTGRSSYKSKSSSYSKKSGSSVSQSSSSQSTSPVTGSSSNNRKSYSGSYTSYDDGYEDVYEEDDYDWDRYYSDDDYADGVDDAMDELDW